MGLNKTLKISGKCITGFWQFTASRNGVVTKAHEQPVPSREPVEEAHASVKFSGTVLEDTHRRRRTVRSH
jgi:hypothetical protein